VEGYVGGGGTVRNVFLLNVRESIKSVNTKRRESSGGKTARKEGERLFPREGQPSCREESHGRKGGDYPITTGPSIRQASLL